LLIFSIISHIHCLVAVCQPLIKLLLTYLLTVVIDSEAHNNRPTYNVDFVLN